MANSSAVPLPALPYLRSRTHPPTCSLYLFFQHPYLLIQISNSFIGDGQQLYSILPWSMTEETVLSAYTKHSSLSLRRCYTGRFLNNTVLQHSCPKNLCCKSSRVKSPLQKTDQSNNYIPPAITISYRAKTTNLVNPHVWRRLGVTGVPEETIILFYNWF